MEGMKKQAIIACILAAISSIACAEWPTYPIASDTFGGSGSIVWIPNADARNTSLSYKILDGDTAIVSFSVIGSDVHGCGNALTIKLPDGVIPAAYINGASGSISGLSDDTTVAAVYVSPDVQQIVITPHLGGICHPQNQVSAFGQIVFPIRH